METDGERIVRPAGERRIVYLDVLRGVAILGLLPANIPHFALPTADSVAFRPPDPASAADRWVWMITHFLVDYKFLSLFSLLFGVGILLMRRSCERRELRFAPVMLRRLGFLLLVGALHGILIWWGDVLTYYALLGMVVFAASGWKPRTLERVGVSLLLVPVVVLGMLIPLLALAHLLGGGDGPVAPGLSTAGRVLPAVDGSWSEFWAAFRFDDPAFETALYREGSFLRITVLRSLTWFLGLVPGFAYYGWRVAGLFLIGMAWAKDGWFLAPAERRESFRQLGRTGLWIGLPLTVLSCGLVQLEVGGHAGTAAAELAHYTGSLGLAAAYAAAVGLACARERRPRAFGPLGAIGRTAFSNYLMQSVVLTLFFYSYGAGFFGMLDRLQLWIVAAAVGVAQWHLSAIWLGWFRLGPLEWLWRSVTHLSRADRSRAGGTASA